MHSNVGLLSCSKTSQTITLRRCSSSCWTKKALLANTTSCICLWTSDLDQHSGMPSSISSHQRTLAFSSLTSMVFVAGHFPAEKSLKSLGAAQCKVLQQLLNATATAPSCTRMFPIVTNHACSTMALGLAFRCQQSLSVCLKKLS